MKAPSIVQQPTPETTEKYLGHLLFFRKGAYLAGFANLKDGVDGAKVARDLATKIP